MAQANGSGKKSFNVQLSAHFIVVSFSLASVIAFGLGQILCRHYVVGDGPTVLRQHDRVNHDVLPHPVLSSDKEMPNNLYTSKQFDTGAPITIDSIFLYQSDSSSSVKPVPELEDALDGDEDGEEDEEEGEDEYHGQHLFVDIKNVNGDFLNSKESLAEAMNEMVKLSGLTILSYHCHPLEPFGVGCVAVLLEMGHVAFHTWPVPGVISLDLFTFGSRPLRPLVKFAEKLFGIPRQPVNEETVAPLSMKWMLKNRGFDRTGTKANPEAIELERYMLGWMEYDLREEVATVETDFQTIDVFDVIDPHFRSLKSYQKSLSGDGSYESQHPEFFRPDRVIYLDGIMQSRRYGDAAYHESLVHPAMFAHDMPRRVAIIGGGEGATLREVLKHNTVENVMMVEIDGIMVNASKTFLPEWSDCSKLSGSAQSCFDDPRAELLVADAIGWFIDHFGKGVKYNYEDRFDVIIMDALDPNSFVEFSDVLYSSDELIEALSNALTEEGILVAQLGEADFLDDPPNAYTNVRVIEQSFLPKLQQHGFETIKQYEDSHGGFLGPWSYIIAFKSTCSSERWYGNQAMIDHQIQQRIISTVSGESSLRYFDGASLLSLSYPSRAVQEVFCRRDAIPTHCDRGHGFDPEMPNAKTTSFEVKTGDVSGDGLGIYFKDGLPEESYIALDEAVHSMIVYPGTRRLMMEMTDFCIRWKVFDSFLLGYGFATDFFGDASYVVGHASVNHGCNATDNVVGGSYSATEMTADPHRCQADIRESPATQRYFHHPYFDRNYHHLFHQAELLRDGNVGDELFVN